MRYTNIRYSTLLNEAQYDYLSDECQDISRMKCFKTFIRLAAMEQTTVTKPHFSAVLQPGQFMASKVELSLMWDCNRKTATRIIREFNQMGILRSEPSNRTTIHTLLCLSVWFTDQRTIKNPFFGGTSSADTGDVVKVMPPESLAEGMKEHSHSPSLSLLSNDNTRERMSSACQSSSETVADNRHYPTSSNLQSDGMREENKQPTVVEEPQPLSCHQDESLLQEVSTEGKEIEA